MIVTVPSSGANCIGSTSRRSIPCCTSSTGKRGCWLINLDFLDVALHLAT